MPDWDGMERRHGDLSPEEIVVRTLQATGQYQNGGSVRRFWKDWGQTIISLGAILGAIFFAWSDLQQERAVVLNELNHIKFDLERVDRKVDRVDDKVNGVILRR